MTSVPFYRKQLNGVFAERVDRNPRYSLRAYASSLDIDPSVCSQILSGKRVPSIAVAERIIGKLNLSVMERKAFLQSIGKEKLNSGLKRVNPKLRSMAQKQEAPKSLQRDLSIDAFQAVSQWHYYAILQLVKIPDFEDSPHFISQRLGISEAEASVALTRLLELQMLERIDGKLVRTHESFNSADPHLTTVAHRKRQKDILNKSIQALESDPIDLRNHSAMTVAIDPALIPEAKKKISRFLQSLAQFLESGNVKEVYEIQTSLFSLQTKIGREVKNEN